MTLRPEVDPTMTTTATPGGDVTDWRRQAWISGGVIAVIVMGFLCIVLGAIYAYIYFTRINPRAVNRTAARKYVEQAPPADDAPQGTSTHLFLFKKVHPVKS